MEALLAISGLLAAVGIGAVGVGYARTRGGRIGDTPVGDGPPLSTGQKGIIDDAAVSAGAIFDAATQPDPAVAATNAPIPTIATGPSAVAGFGATKKPNPTAVIAKAAADRFHEALLL